MKLSGADAFVAIDLDGAEASSGPVRAARKVLRGGVEDLARSQTYTYAVLGMRHSGASAGINADSAERARAVTAFVEEAAPLVADRTYLPDAAKGVDETDLASLRGADPRSRIGPFAHECEGLSAAVSADAAVGLDGRTVVIEGAGPAGPALAAAAAQRGAEVISAPGDSVLTTPADVVFTGSRMGVVNHAVAEGLRTEALVPCGRLPYTARALAVCRRRGILALPDFVVLAGSTIAAWSDPGASDDDVRAAVTTTVTELVAEAVGHPDGPFLAACYTAEAFLSTWQAELPFGRPLAP